MLSVRCEICDCWLPLFQLSKLCPTCYKIRTIVKCYNTDKILKTLQEHFLIEDLPPLIPIKEEPKVDEPVLESDDQKDYSLTKTRAHKKTLEEIKRIKGIQ